MKTPAGGIGRGPFYRWRVRRNLGRKTVAKMLEMNAGGDSLIMEWDWNGIPEKHLAKACRVFNFDFQTPQDKWKFGEVGPTEFSERLLWLARQGYHPARWEVARFLKKITPDFAGDIRKRRSIVRKRAIRVRAEWREGEQQLKAVKKLIKERMRG